MLGAVLGGGRIDRHAAHRIALARRSGKAALVAASRVKEALGCGHGMPVLLQTAKFRNTAQLGP